MVITINTGIINTSLQVNDEIYCVPIDNSISGFATGDPIYIGRVINILGSKIEIKDPVMHTPQLGDFLMFSKDKSANNTSLVGYYAEVTLKNNSTEKAELFALSSEIAQSSK